MGRVGQGHLNHATTPENDKIQPKRGAEDNAVFFWPAGALVLECPEICRDVQCKNLMYSKKGLVYKLHAGWFINCTPGSL